MKKSLILLLFFNFLMASSFSFYDSGINYWPSEERQIEKKLDKKSVEKKDDKFDWKKALDPNNDEFYRQGNHMPPAAMVEAMKNPTDQNIKRYFELEEKRERKLSQFIKKSNKYRLKKLERELSKLSKPKIRKNSFYNARELRSKYRIRMYFDSNCPHCKRMHQNLLKLQRDGFTVDLVQIDDGVNPLQGIKSRKIAKGEGSAIKLFNGGVPYTLIFNRKTKKMKSLRGFIPMDKFLTILR